MKCEICGAPVAEMSGASGRRLCQGHKHGRKMATVPEDKIVEFVEAGEAALTASVTAVPPDLDLFALLGAELANLLIGGGFGDYSAVRAASDEDLLAVEGIGQKRLAAIREALG